MQQVGNLKRFRKDEIETLEGRKAVGWQPTEDPKVRNSETPFFFARNLVSWLLHGGFPQGTVHPKSSNMFNRSLPLWMFFFFSILSKVQRSMP